MPKRTPTKPPATRAQRTTTRRTAATQSERRKPAGDTRRTPARKSDTNPGPATTAADRSKYARHRQRAAAAQRIQSNTERELGKLPAPANPERRAACEADLRVALLTYFPDTFALNFSSQHLDVIATAQDVLRSGGLYAIGMARGSGKTAITIRIALLALLFGWRRYLVLIGASQDAASELVDAIKIEIETNPTLAEDFPEVCLPIRALEGIAQRAKGQTVDGIPTAIRWNGRRRLVLPTVTGSQSSGACLQSVGILGRIRGMNHITQDGKTLRPDCILGDDLQTDQSAKNVAQVERRHAILNGAVLGLSGPGRRMSGLITITVQRRGDLADRILDPKISPQWQPRRFSLVEAWPDRLDLWDRYAELREADLAAGRDTLTTATAFYKSNRDDMDRGAVVPWAQRHEPHEISALQNAFNLRLRDQASFDAEYQNTPTAIVEGASTIALIDSDTLVRRVSGYARAEIPTEATRLFLGVDVQQDVLFWLALAMAEDFTGHIIDYGAWPEQIGAHYWQLSDLQHTITKATGLRSLESSLLAGLNRLGTTLADREWTRDDGAAMRIDRLIVDANWGPSTKTVYSWVRQFDRIPALAFHGRGITAKQMPLAQRKRKPGELAGAEWFIPSTKGTKAARHVVADVNAIKSILRERLLTPLGDPGAFSLYKADPARHRMIADHLAAEYPTETSGRGRTLLEWSLFPGRENHWLDCLVMATTAALIAGLSPEGSTSDRRPHGKRRASLRDLYKPKPTD